MTLQGLSEFNAAIDEIVAAVDSATKDAVATAAHLIEANAKKHASGRPGPNVVTGSDRRSFNVLGPVGIGSLGYTAEVGPSMIYSRRLELGFVGEDAIGRVYASPANPAKYPALQPGLEESIPDIPEIFEAAWSAALELS